jgi:chorismate mutase
VLIFIDVMGKTDLDSLRKDIAQIDDSIIALLVKRFDLTDEVGRIKNKNNIPIENFEVEKKVLERLIVNSEEKIDKQLVFDIYAKIFANSKERQKNV